MTSRNPYEIQVNTKRHTWPCSALQHPCYYSRNPYEIQVNTKISRKYLLSGFPSLTS